MPIASLTKMMTALVVVAHSTAERPGADHARRRSTSPARESGCCRSGKRVPEMALLYGLLLPSGNDAAIALAQHVAQTQDRFIAMMNAHARAMGLRCTHFATVSGVVDQGNYSCATDLARARPRRPRAAAAARGSSPPAARSCRSRSRADKLFLYNNNPLLLTPLSGRRRRQDRLHDAGRPVPGGRRAPRPHVVRRRAAALGQPGRTGGEAAERGVCARALNPTADQSARRQRLALAGPEQQLVDPLDRPRPREQIALGELAAQLAEFGQLAGALDALGGDRDVERLRDAEHRTDDRAVIGVGARGRREASGRS